MTISAGELSQKTVVLNLTLHKPGNSGKVDPSTVDVVARDGEAIDPEMVHVSKDLLKDYLEYEAIKTLYSSIRKQISSIALPTKTLKNGMYLFSGLEAERIEDILNAFNAQLVPLKEALSDTYPAKVEECFARLGAAADPMDYPPTEAFVDAVSIEWQWLTFTAPYKVVGFIETAMLTKAENKIQAQMAGYKEQIEKAYELGMKGLVDNFLAILHPADGKKKKLTDKAIEKANAFIESFFKNNVTEHGKLAGLVSQAQSLINGATPEEINTSPNIKDFITGKMDEIRMSLDELVVNRTERKIVLLQKPVTVAEEEVNHANG